ncbi:MAG: cation-translocating P-type ATPase [Actinobacteria bacterium]|nr:cation-translocating P-type ATPase [Actinomycetota bacterium]
MSELTEAPATPAPGSGLFGEADLSQHRLLRRNLWFLVPAVACTLTGAVLGLWFRAEPWATTGHVIDLIGFALGYPMFLAAAKTVLFERNKLTTEVFITLALIAVLYQRYYWYAAWIVFIMWLGETLMAWAGRHARDAVEALLKLVPRQARLLTPDGAALVPVDQVRPGQEVEVRPDERIPVDGVVAQGQTSIDESMLTGESVPADRGSGENVFAGTYNVQGTIRVRATAAAEDNAVARIVALMRQAQRAQIPAKRTVDTFLRWFLPLVLVSTAVTGLLTGSMTRVASILLVITPCAFSASTPLALIATVGAAARRGLIVKNGAAIEALSRASVVLLDKTGTLTAATPQLAAVDACAGTEQEIITLAAIAEKHSTHPLARAVVTAAGERGLAVPDPDRFELAHGGILADGAGHRLMVGNEPFLRSRGIPVPGSVRSLAARQEEAGHTVAYLVRDGSVGGVLGFLAQPRASAPGVISDFRKLGVREIVMLTGDRDLPARAVAARLGIGYRAQATPEQKLQEVRRFQQDGRVVAMVGDGINDATALAAADVGVAMVGAGTEVAAMAAGIIVHGDRLARVITAARLCRRGIRTIRLNLFFATSYNIAGLVLALLGVVSPGTAALFHAASFISVVLNSGTVLLYRPQ